MMCNVNPTIVDEYTTKKEIENNSLLSFKTEEDRAFGAPMKTSNHFNDFEKQYYTKTNIGVFNNSDYLHRGYKWGNRKSSWNVTCDNIKNDDNYDSHNDTVNDTDYYCNTKNNSSDDDMVDNDENYVDSMFDIHDNNIDDEYIEHDNKNDKDANFREDKRR